MIDSKQNIFSYKHKYQMHTSECKQKTPIKKTQIVLRKVFKRFPSFYMYLHKATVYQSVRREKCLSSFHAAAKTTLLASSLNSTCWLTVQNPRLSLLLSSVRSKEIDPSRKC